MWYWKISVTKAEKTGSRGGQCSRSLKVQAMFAPGVAIGDSAKQEEQNLPVSGAQKSLVLFGVVLRVILIHRCLHILVEALHSLVVVIY